MRCVSFSINDELEIFIISFIEMHCIFMQLPVTLFFNPTRQPNIFARSPTIAVNNPIIPRDTKKHGHPPNKPAGGINANMICQIVKYKVF